MSGGHWDYIQFKIEEIAIELNPKKSLSERELGMLLMDLKDVIHDADYYYSGDYGLDQFEKIWKEFKDKWIKKDALSLNEKIIEK